MRAIALAAFVFPLAVAGVAEANAAQTFVRAPEAEGGAFLERPTRLVVEHEELSFRCDATDCAFTAVYHVRNPGDVREEVLGAFYGIATDAFQAVADGADARRELTPEQLAAVDANVAAIDPALAHDASVGRSGFALAVEAGERATITFSGRMRPVSRITGAAAHGFAQSPIEVRHVWLGTRERREAKSSYAYAVSPIRSWGGAPMIDVEVHVPDARFWADGQDDWTATDERGETVARRRIASRDVTTLRFELVTAPGTSVLHGGPLVGVGSRFDTRGIRARFGYEVAAPSWLIVSAAVDTDFASVTTLAPLAEVASPNLLVFIPSVGVGAGVPVQLRSGSSPRVGFRGQLTLSFPVVSLVFPLDVYPGAPRGDVWQAGLYGQASF